MAEVVNIRNSSYDVLIVRPSKWGNGMLSLCDREPK